MIATKTRFKKAAMTTLSIIFKLQKIKYKEIIFRDFPSGAVIKNLPANAGDICLSPGPGKSHML